MPTGTRLGRKIVPRWSHGDDAHFPPVLTHAAQIVAKAPPAALAPPPPATAVARPERLENHGLPARKDEGEEEEEEEGEGEGPAGRIVDATLGVGVVFKSDKRGFYKVVEVVQVWHGSP